MIYSDAMSNIYNVHIEEELQSSYIDYAMSVIIGRAIPDARDGLKPAQRRILYAMYSMKNTHDQPTKKSARIVGEVIGKYHPHGDIAVYDTLVRMAQQFSINHPFIEGQGNFGSIDGDPPAAMRYTEVRLTKLSEDMLHDIEKETVEMVPNFDNTEKEPAILPAMIPNLLINGASGIAVGVATNIPPHNLEEICDAIRYRLENNEASVDDMLKIIKGPDFPTGGTVVMSENSYNGYKYGRGQLLIRAKAETDEEKKRIEIREIPYGVNKSLLIQNIANLVRAKKIVGIRNIRDESDKSGINVVIELKSDVSAEHTLNILYRHTQLEITYPIINLAVVNRSLKSMNILQLINTFIDYRRHIILSRTKYDLKVASDRLHIIDGLLSAISRIDDIIKTIRRSENSNTAKTNLITDYSLSEKQAVAILDMRLSRLTHLESESLQSEKHELTKKAEGYSRIISDPKEIDKIIAEEMEELKKKYGKKRKTEIINSDSTEISDEDLISNEKVTIILTAEGYVKRIKADSYKEQARGGKGTISINLNEGDYVKHIVTCNNKDYLVCFSNVGRAYWIKAYNIPESSRYTEGKAIVNLLNISNEKIVDIINIVDFTATKLLFLTSRGLIKKVRGELFSRPRANGIRAITLNQNDNIADVVAYTEAKYAVIVTAGGKAIKFMESKVRFTGRSSMGVRGIRIHSDIAKNILTCGEEGSVLTVTEKGFGKLTGIEKYRLQNRGGKGVINIRITAKTGNVSKALLVKDEKHLLLINSKGISITIPIASIRRTGRQASGVRLMKVGDARITDARLLLERQQDDATQVT